MSRLTEGVSYFDAFGRRDLPVSIAPGRRDLWSRCSRSAGPSDVTRASERVSPALSIVTRWRFRSFRSLMSIEKRVAPFSRSFRSLIKTRAALAKSIKDLKDLRILRRHAGYRHSGPTDLKRTRDVFSVAGTMARDRPSPYDEGAFCRPIASRPGGLSYGDL